MLICATSTYGQAPPNPIPGPGINGEIGAAAKPRATRCRQDEAPGIRETKPPGSRGSEAHRPDGARIILDRPLPPRCALYGVSCSYGFSSGRASYGDFALVLLQLPFLARFLSLWDRMHFPGAIYDLSKMSKSPPTSAPREYGQLYTNYFASKNKRYLFNPVQHNPTLFAHFDACDLHFVKFMRLSCLPIPPFLVLPFFNQYSSEFLSIPRKPRFLT